MPEYEKMNIQQGSWQRCVFKTAKKVEYNRTVGSLLRLASTTLYCRNKWMPNENFYNNFKCHKTISFLTIEVFQFVKKLSVVNSLSFPSGGFNYSPFILTLRGFIVI